MDTIETVTDGVLNAIESFDDFDGEVYPTFIPGRLALVAPDGESWLVEIRKLEID